MEQMVNKEMKLFEVDEKAPNTVKNAGRRVFLKKNITAIQEHNTLRGNHTVFYDDNWHVVFQIKGHFNVEQCEQIFSLRYYTYKEGKKDGRNEIREKFNSLLESED